MTCIIPDPSQPDYSLSGISGVAGNIGIVNAKVTIWDHDPFYARPLQKLTYPFTQDAQQQIKTSISGLSFEANAAFLKPKYIPQDMFVATKIQTGTRDEPTETGVRQVPVFGLDFVGSRSSGVGAIAEQRLPPSTGVEGKEYTANGYFPVDLPTSDNYNWRIGKDIFPHQVWVYIGNIFRNAVPVHPSEYSINDSELIAIKSIQNPDEARSCPPQNWTIEEIKNAPRWDYNSIEDGAGHRAISPVQVTKPPEDAISPVHWTLEKFTPTFQGEDFFVTIAKNEKELTNVEDVDPASDCVDTSIESYKYLIYDPQTKPVGWVDGLSNAAFWMERDKEQSGTGTQETIDRSTDPRRDTYWWRYKSYILIEIGVEDPQHNYFIEIVKGRKPRFLHLGYEWDNPKKKTDGVEVQPDDWTFIKKCRELSEYEFVSSDELFKKKDFRVAVRNHLGRFHITFEGYEGDPWVVTRLDNDPSQFNDSKIVVPMVVPAGKMRIHGGNISTTLNFAPIEYPKRVTVPFNDQQFDTGEIENDDLYMTFSYIGNSIKFDNPGFKRRYFRDSRFGYGRLGYDCDAYIAQELNKNVFKELNLYEGFDRQYRKYGKGWVNERDANAIGQATVDPLTGLFGIHRLRSGVDPDRGGVPHKLEIVNLRTPGQTFIFGLNEASDSSYPYKEYASRWDVGVRFQAGSVMMPIVQRNDEIVIDSSARRKRFDNVVTPIGKSWSIYVLPGGKPIQDNVDPIDVSELIQSINDSWSAEDFTTINHEMSLQAYIPLGVPHGGDPANQPNPARSDLHALGQKMLKLIDKAFYVTVSYWWENGIGQRDAQGNKLSRNGPPRESDLLIQMTGVAYGGSIERSVNKILMDFTVKDYMSVLSSQYIFNSPFFDGVADTEAIYELMKMAHFDDSREKTRGIDRRPLGFLQKAIEDADRIGDGKFTYNGEESRTRRFDLPGTYADIANPAVKFQNGESYDSAIKKIAQQASKVVYFDRWGVLRYENIPAIEAAFSSGVKEDFTPVFEFRTSPFNSNSSGGDEGSVASNRFRFSPRRDAAHLVYNVVTYNRSVEDCVNQIVLLTASNDIQLADGTRAGGFIVEGYTFFEQIWNPNAEGFLGFRKPFYQSNGLFGGIEGIRNGLLQYAKMKFPPAMISFQTMGVPGLKALDIISLDDNLFYITEIAHEIDPAENSWNMNISGEWLKPFLGDLGFLEERGTTDSDGGGGTTEGEG